MARPKSTAQTTKAGRVKHPVETSASAGLSRSERHALGWEFEFCLVVDEIARLQKVVAGQQMKRYRITQVQWVALVYVSRNDGMRQVDLQVELGITRGGCTHLVNRLQNAGLVICRPDDHDGRVNRLFIADSAKRVLGKIQIIAEHIHKDIFQNVSETDGNAAIALMYGIKDRLLSLNGGNIFE